MNIRLLTVAACAVALGAPVAALARPDSDARQVNVSYSDLNLGTASGRAVLKSRIRKAAERVCGLDDNPQLRAFKGAQACVDRSVGAAMARLPVRTQMAVSNDHNG
jgi:UrcA family protein